MVYNVNTFTIHESLFQNFIKMLPAIYQNKTKVLKKKFEFQVQVQFPGSRFRFQVQL